MPEQRIILEEAVAREIRGLLLQLRDEVLHGMMKRKEITFIDLVKIRGIIERVQASELSDEMERILSRYYRWSFDEGVKQIDGMLRGEAVADVLNLPAANTIQAAGFTADKIKTIAPELIKSTSDALSLMFVGVRTPAELQLRIHREFDVSIRHAETIARTEIGRAQNRAAEARVAQAFKSAREVGIPMSRVWLHSSGKVQGFAKGKKRAQYEPRPHHKAMHGVTVPEYEKFKLTNPRTGETWHVDGPHDEALPAGEVINCYCKRGVKIDREEYERRKAAR